MVRDQRAETTTLNTILKEVNTEIKEEEKQVKFAPEPVTTKPSEPQDAVNVQPQVE